MILEKIYLTLVFIGFLVVNLNIFPSLFKIVVLILPISKYSSRISFSMSDSCFKSGCSKVLLDLQQSMKTDFVQYFFGITVDRNMSKKATNLLNFSESLFMQFFINIFPVLQFSQHFIYIFL